ncbi:MAG TPA: DNA repair protein RecN [Saprospiraceae bacterium]|nr:DNA repair protein RecN [Saprospiraceae bacterium]
MLTSLSIKNYAIIDHLQINWEKGFTTMTGETGAGKSIIIGALQLVLGNRSDVKDLKNNELKCIVEAEFQISKELLLQLNDRFELDNQQSLILRREIFPTGKTRSFINDSPVLLNVIQSLAPFLLNIHQQFDHLDLFDRSFQMESLDKYASLTEIVLNYENKFKSLQALINQFNKQEEALKSGLLEKEFIEFQWNELSAAQLKEDELTGLEDELKLVTKAEEIKTNCMQLFEIIQSERGLLDQTQTGIGLLKNIQVNENLKNIYSRLDSIRTELKDLSLELENIADQTELSPERIRQINHRLDQLNRLLKKHRAHSEFDLIQLRDQLESKLNQISVSDENLLKLQYEIDQLHNQLIKEAQSISKKRKAAIPEFVSNIQKLLLDLGMLNAKVEIQLQQNETLNSEGLDQIDFLFCANKGGLVRPLKEQASGGELARFNLAVKSLIATKNEGTCMIFDEIDTGVSGQIALQMGNILKAMSQMQQLICITHSPQVASRADQHYYVYKEHTKNDTATKIRKLNKEERLNELAKMLSGEPPTKAALKNAAELMSL